MFGSTTEDSLLRFFAALSLGQQRLRRGGIFADAQVEFEGWQVLCRN